jgi:hypothetical protein
METANCFEMSVCFYQNIQRHIVVDNRLQNCNIPWDIYKCSDLLLKVYWFTF